MVEYNEFKREIARIFGKRISEENDDDIKIFEDTGFITGEAKDNESAFIISNRDLKELYNKINDSIHNKLELFGDNSYEIAIELEYPIMIDEQFPIISEDKINGITYRLGYPSIEYCTFLLLKFIEERNKGLSRIMYPVRFSRARYSRGFDNTEEQLDWKELLPKMMRVLSLRIETDKKRKSVDIKKYKTSFIFQFMYQSNVALVEYNEIKDIFRFNRSMRYKIDFEKLNTQPLREYIGDVIDYYKLALATNDPYIQFISFYHVIEYFYDEIFKKRIISDLRDQITNPGFSYKDDEKVYKIAIFVKKRMKMNNDFGQGNELESLIFVLNEYVVIDELKQRITELDESAVEYYNNYKVPFCNASKISWSDNQGVYNYIAKRIYGVRNSLVHSKSGKNYERYKPYQDEHNLQKEIPLVKSVAEQIIIKSSSLL